MPNKEKCMDVLVGTSVSLLLTLFLFRKFFFSRGFAFFGEFGANVGRADYATYLWDPLNQKPLLPNHLLIDSWSSMLASELGQRIPLMLSFALIGASMFFSSYNLLRTRFDRIETLLGALFATSFYMINPFTTTRIPHGKMLFLYALIPALFYLLHISFSKLETLKKVTVLRNSLITALLLFVMSVSVRLPFLLPLFVSILIVHIKQILRNLEKFLLYIVFTSTIFVVTSSIWILPTFAGSSNFPSPPTYILTNQVLDVLSRHSSILNVLTMNSHWNEGARTLLTPSSPNLEFARYIGIGLIPVLAFSSLLIVRKRKDVLALALTALISIFLAKGSNPPFSDFYYWFVFDSPISYFGWMFRGSVKFSFLAVTPALILLSSFSVSFLAEKIHSFNLDVKSRSILTTMLFSALLVIPLLSGFPLLSGDVGGGMYIQEIPENYLNTYEWLEMEEGEFKVLWYPSVPNWGAVGSSIRDDLYWNYLQKKAFENGLWNPARLLAPWGIRYIIVRGDSLEEAETTRILSFLASQEGIRFVKNFTDIYIFQSSEHSEQVSILSQNVWLSGGIDKISAISGSILPAKSSILFSDYFDLKDESIFDVFMWDDPDLIYNIVEDCILIEPFQHTRDYNPDQVWSRAATTDPLHGRWHPYIERFGIENWQFDYGKGLVFTRSSSLIPESTTPVQSDLLASWEFETRDSIETWKYETQEVQFGATQVLGWEDGSLKVELYNSTWGWKTIKSPLVDAAIGRAYRFHLSVKGQDSHKVHAQILEYDSKKTNIHCERLGAVGKETFDWRIITADYYPKNEETKYIQLQVWHGSQTEQPLPNIIWLDDVKIYNMSRYTQPITIEIPFNIEREKDYKLLIRYFANSEGGKIQVYIDDERFDLTTKNQLNRFTWKELQTLHLEEGEHKLILRNVHGLNAVNMLTFISLEEYLKAIEEIQKLLNDRMILYVFEAESDLYQEETEISQEFEWEASNGKAIILSESSKVWREIEILREDTYRLVARLEGQIEVKIADQTFVLSSNNSSFVHSDTIDLKMGKQNIDIRKLLVTVATWNFSDDIDYLSWKQSTPQSDFYNLFTEADTLRAELNETTAAWRVMRSPAVFVNYGSSYNWTFYIKGENSHKVHAKIRELNSEGGFIGTQLHIGVGDGSYDWKRMAFSYSPSSPEVVQMQLEIWHGYETTKPLPNILWLKDPEVTRVAEETCLDLVLLYSIRNENETLEEIFASKEDPAQIADYRKIDPTKYVTEVNATKPFMLSFAEAYDPLWAAYVNGKEYQSIPLHSIVNGFWINQTGQLQITIEYKPQKWFHIGSAVSITTLLLSITYLTYDILIRNRKPSTPMHSHLGSNARTSRSRRRNFQRGATKLVKQRCTR